jgi:dipeptidyl-peptidase 4
VSRLTAEALFGSAALTGSVAQQLRWAPTGAAVGYLANPAADRHRVDLWLFDVATGQPRHLVDTATVETGALDDAEKAARERRRAFTGGVSDYRWLADGSAIACCIDGAIHLVGLGDDAWHRVTPSGSRQTDLEVSPGGRYISYVRAANLFVYDRQFGLERQLTDDGSATLSHGRADFIAQEEMHRFSGHWWSRDDRYVVFTSVDESAIPISHRYEFGATELTVHAQRYPFAGAANARVELSVFDLRTAALRTLDYRDADDDYLARVDVTAAAIVVQVQRRDQRVLTVKSFPLAGGAARVLLREEQPAWINLHDNFYSIGPDDSFVWTSERNGSAQLYLYRNGRCELCSGALARVNSVLYADMAKAFVLGWREAPTEQHLFRIDYAAPARATQLTETAGWHDGAIDTGGHWFAECSSSLQHPAALRLIDLAGQRPAAPILANDLTTAHPYHPFVATHATPTLGCIDAADGQTLWYRLTLPTEFDPARRWPVLIHVYGGPGVQRVRDEWAPLALQLFAAAGIAVFELDNRGSSNRSKRFEDPICGLLGRIEVDDQLAGLHFLAAQAWVDPARIGVMGHSYGGYMALQLMMHGNGMLRAGIASAPVTDWQLYDTHYTERYLSRPQDNADGYRDSSVFAHLPRLRGALLLIHGMADDNVLLGHTTKLMHELQQRRYAFELMLYPGAKHALQEPAVAIHRHDTMLAFLQRHLTA